MVQKTYKMEFTLTQINFLQMLVNERRIEVERSGKQPPMTIELLEDLREIFNEKLHQIGFLGGEYVESSHQERRWLGGMGHRTRPATPDSVHAVRRGFL